MRYVDEVKVYVAAGDGGAGCVGWCREKYKPMGGPDGGNGGNGGAVIFSATNSLNTLIDYSFNPHITAENGTPGSGQGCHGKAGKDKVIPLPVGTQVYYQDELVADLNVVGAKWIAARGGNGGLGNEHFKTATNRAPDFAQPGQAGEKFNFKLVLKSIADVGIIGLPNAGKSTLISKISAATPKIADYPFTTIRPNLGVVSVGEEQSYVVADIPGLIPEAHTGKGLGIEFLKHVERTSALLQLIDVSQEQEILAGGSEAEQNDELILQIALKQFETIDKELSAFSEDLTKKPRLVAFSKADLPVNSNAYNLCKSKLDDLGYKTLLFSSETNMGLDELKRAVYELLNQS